jgi:hypothetical protein
MTEEAEGISEDRHRLFPMFAVYSSIFSAGSGDRRCKPMAAASTHRWRPVTGAHDGPSRVRRCAAELCSPLTGRRAGGGRLQRDGVGWLCSNVIA